MLSARQKSGRCKRGLMIRLSKGLFLQCRPLWVLGAGLCRGLCRIYWEFRCTCMCVRGVTGLTTGRGCSTTEGLPECYTCGYILNPAQCWVRAKGDAPRGDPRQLPWCLRMRVLGVLRQKQLVVLLVLPDNQGSRQTASRLFPCWRHCSGNILAQQVQDMHDLTGDRLHGGQGVGYIY